MDRHYHLSHSTDNDGKMTDCNDQHACCRFRQIQNPAEATLGDVQNNLKYLALGAPFPIYPVPAEARSRSFGLSACSCLAVQGDDKSLCRRGKGTWRLYSLEKYLRRADIDTENLFRVQVWSWKTHLIQRQAIFNGRHAESRQQRLYQATVSTDVKHEQL